MSVSLKVRLPNTTDFESSCFIVWGCLKRGKVGVRALSTFEVAPLLASVLNLVKSNEIIGLNELATELLIEDGCFSTISSTVAGELSRSLTWEESGTSRLVAFFSPMLSTLLYTRFNWLELCSL